MATNDNVPTDVTMESLANGMQTLSTGMQAIRAELNALQSREGIQNLSLNERGWERTYRPFQGAPRPHNMKVQYFSDLPGKNFLAWRSQFQVIADYHCWSDDEAKQLMYAYMKGTALESVMDVPLTGEETPKRLWINTSAGSSRKAIRSCCERSSLAWFSSRTNPLKSYTPG